VRALIKNESVGAVVLFVDSGGGAVIAAEAMTSALQELSKKCPLVVYMNGVAASGGYEVATPARWIVAQPGTTTGSIGVVTAKLVAGGLQEKLRAHSADFSRGANAGIFSSQQPFTDAQRAQIRAAVEHYYDQFVSRVASARNMTSEAVDAIGGGRVWTGAQALSHGLVDELGDVWKAIAKARALAKLPEDTPVTIVSRKSKPLPPLVSEAATPAAYLDYCLTNARAIASGTAQALLPFWWESWS
jgi:protease-4